jgi:hypothetical protein
MSLDLVAALIVAQMAPRESLHLQLLIACL